MKALSLIFALFAFKATAAVHFPDPIDFRTVDGVMIDISTNAAWNGISSFGKFEFQSRGTETNVIIARQYEFQRASFSVPADRSARVGGFIGGAAGGGGFSGGSYETKDKIYKEEVAIFNCPKSFLTGEDVKNIWVRRNGEYNYAGKVIAAYDHGVVDERSFAAAHSLSNQIVARITAAKAAAAEKYRQEQISAIPRIVAFQLQQASNGSPSFQIELGKRYMRGDGVETNLALARHWLQAACTNGESQASNLLAQITK